MTLSPAILAAIEEYRDAVQTVSYNEASFSIGRHHRRDEDEAHAVLVDAIASAMASETATPAVVTPLQGDDAEMLAEIRRSPAGFRERFLLRLLDARQVAEREQSLP